MMTTVNKLSYNQKKIIGRGMYGTIVFIGFYYEDMALSRGENNIRVMTAIKRIHKKIKWKTRKVSSKVQHEVELMRRKSAITRTFFVTYTRRWTATLCIYHA